MPPPRLRGCHLPCVLGIVWFGVFLYIQISCKETASRSRLASIVCKFPKAAKSLEKAKESEVKSFSGSLEIFVHQLESEYIQLLFTIFGK